jgi:hypothetical protein
MRPSRREAPGPPDPALDPYRRGVAKASENGVEVGYLWTRVQAWWTVVGHLWWRRGVDPVERPEWFLEFHATYEGSSYPYQEGFANSSTDTADLVCEFETNAVHVNGHTYDLEWLTGPAAEAIPAPGEYWAE